VKSDVARLQHRPRADKGLQISGRVMVDPIGYVHEHSIFRNQIVSNYLREPCISLDITVGHDTKLRIPLRVIDPVDLTSEELMTLPSRIGGYSLVTKDAGFFQVDHFTDIIWDIERAENIRKTSQKMAMILRIASGFSFLTDQFDYQNKGTGLNFLLYGPSGVGKTLTAGNDNHSFMLPHL
jgi:hypothetical protein